MEEDVLMEDTLEEVDGGGGGGGPRYTTPVNGEEAVVSSTTSPNNHHGLPVVVSSSNGVGEAVGVDPNSNSVLSSPASSNRGENNLLRSGNIIMMTLTQEDYEKEYWPRLDSAIHQLLAAPGQYPPLSYEQMYSCVYKCVCKQFAERLYRDLMTKVETHLAQTVTHQIADVDAKAYIEKFNAALNQYMQALGGIVPIFNYMNRFYVESKLGTDLRQELLKLFKLHVIDRHVTDLVPLLLDAQTKPFMVGPAVMANIVKQLHLLSPELIVTQPQLFAKFIPNALPPTSEADLEALREETRRMQEQLATDPDFTSPPRNGNGVKRALD